MNFRREHFCLSIFFLGRFCLCLSSFVQKKDIGKEAGAALNTDGFRRAGSAAGPTSSQATYVPTQDIGKQAPGANTDGFRRAGTAAGPTSSQANYVATQDIGKQAPGANTDGFRRAGAAAGPTSSQATYVPTQDIGKQAPASGDMYWDHKDHA